MAIINGTNANDTINGGIGSDMMLGDSGNDIYYVDSNGDVVSETQDQGTDTIYSSVSYILPENVENGVLTGGQSYTNTPTNTAAVVFGNPEGWGDYLDFYQGDNAQGYGYTCGIVSSANLLIQGGIYDKKIDYTPGGGYIDIMETEIVQFAIDNKLCTTSNSTAFYNGATSASTINQILEGQGMQVTNQYVDLKGLAQCIKDNKCVMALIDANVLWYSDAYTVINHAITVTGVAYRQDNPDVIEGFYICDSGRGHEPDSSRFISAAQMQEAFYYFPSSGIAIVSDDPIKEYIEDLNITGNLLDNILNGNSGNNELAGGAGNDQLYGGKGNDTYIFKLNDDQDFIADEGSGWSGGTNDKIRFEGLSLSEVQIIESGSDLIIKINNTTDQLTVSNTLTDPNMKIEWYEFDDITLSYDEILTFEPLPNTAPVAETINTSVDEDSQVVINPVASDLDGNLISMESVTQGAYGTVVIDQDGNMIYTPDADFYGNDSFTYTVSDGNGGFDTASVNLTVNSVNDAPVISELSASVDENDSVTIDGLSGAFDIDGDALTLNQNPTAAYGTVVINGSNLEYTPFADFSGSDIINYTISDGNGGTVANTVNVTVNPVINENEYTLDEDAQVVITPSTGDMAVTSVTQGTNGTVAINEDGSLVYTPDADYNGTDSFTYTVSTKNFDAQIAEHYEDINGNWVKSSSWYTGHYYYTSDEGHILCQSSYYTDKYYLRNSNNMDVVKDNSGNPVYGDISSLNLPTDWHSTGDKKVIYTSQASYFDGSFETESVTKTISLTITPVNDAPDASPLSVSTKENSALTIDGLCGAFDVDGDSLTIEQDPTAANGTVIINGSNIEYTPDAGFSGSDIINYTISDGNGGTVNNTIDVNVISNGDSDTLIPEHYEDINGNWVKSSSWYTGHYYYTSDEGHILCQSSYYTDKYYLRNSNNMDIVKDNSGNPVYGDISSLNLPTDWHSIGDKKVIYTSQASFVEESISVGDLLSNSDINRVIQELVAFSENNEIDLTNLENARNNSELLNMLVDSCNV